MAIIRSRMKKKGQAKCLGEDLYTLSDPRVSNEELSKIYFLKLFEKSQAT